MINIIILILISLLVYLFFYLKKEHFNEDTTIKEILKNDDESSKKQKYIDTYDDTKNSSDGFDFNLNNIDITSPDIDTYLNNILISKKLQQKKKTELPIMMDNNKSNYNHKLKILINSRKIAQNVVLNILKNKINYLMGTLKNVKDIKKNITD